jgi:tyrosyl-tRNA synthetase
MDISSKIELISRRPVEEVVTLAELHDLLSVKSQPIAYNGFEPSGLMHIGTGLATAFKIMDLTQAGVKFKILLATWHAKLNNKFGGDMEKIRKVAQYFIEGWTSLGVQQSLVEYVMAEDLISDTRYWELLLRISEKVTYSKVVRALPIMGRKQSDSLRFGSYIYPLMQVTDIFMLEADIAQLGMDQRKANILAKEVGPSLGLWSPIAVHHHLLAGLNGPTKMGLDENPILDSQFSSKMAKSKPDSAIFIHDSPDMIRSKIKKAYCPERVLEDNPIIDYAQNLILRTDSDVLEIERPSHKGGSITLTWPQLKTMYSRGEIHPLDLKNAVASSLIRMLEPSRKHFATKLEELKAFSPSV